MVTLNLVTLLKKFLMTNLIFLQYLWAVNLAKQKNLRIFYGYKV